MTGSPTRTTVLVVSKPICPPWTDSSRVLVRDLVRAGADVAFRVLGTPDFHPAWPGVTWEPVYRHAGRYAPGLRQNLVPLLRLLRPRLGADVLHFFFAPNPRTSAVVRLLSAPRRQRTVQTICSAPSRFDGVARLMFADRVVAVSEHTARRLQVAGVPHVRTIHPGVDPERLVPADPNPYRDALGLQERPVVLFAGDLEESAGVGTLVEAWPRVRAHVPNAVLVMACRPKTAEATVAQQRLRHELAATGTAASVRLLGEVDDMASLLDACDVCVLPVRSLYRKMDVPLVLLEAMALGKPVVTSDVEPLCEVLRVGGGLAAPCGDAEALAARLVEVLTGTDRRAALGAEAREAVRTYWNAARMARQYAALYAELRAA